MTSRLQTQVAEDKIYAGINILYSVLIHGAYKPFLSNWALAKAKKRSNASSPPCLSTNTFKSTDNVYFQTLF